MSEKKIPRPNQKAAYLTFLVGTDKQKVRVKVKDEGIIIGRTTRNKAVDLDTKPHNGDRLGVSRQHALIAPEKDYFCVQDLESVNSTWLNKVRLRPLVAEELYHGDILHLGECRLEVYFTYEDEVLDALGVTEVLDAELPQTSEVKTGQSSDEPDNSKRDTNGKTGILSDLPETPKDADPS